MSSKVPVVSRDMLQINHPGNFNHQLILETPTGHQNVEDTQARHRDWINLSSEPENGRP